jgi:hypothetical protein
MVDESVSYATLPDSELSLLELADRLLYRGAVFMGNATLSVAGVDLIYMGLNILLTDIENVSGVQSSGSEPQPHQGTYLDLGPWSMDQE